MFRVAAAAELRGGPVTVRDALLAGVTRKELRGPRWRRVRRGMYVWSGIPLDPTLELEAVVTTLPPTAIFSGPTAAWLHDLDIGPGRPLDLTLPIGAGVSGRASLRLRRVVSMPDAVLIHGFRATTIERTLVDLARSLKLLNLVPVMDQALRLGITDHPRLEAAAASNRGRPGIPRFRQAMEFSDSAAESPMESRLRVVLLQAGLPRPVSQAELHGSDGTFLGRVDLYYPAAKLAIEYDGDVHRTQLERDNRRQNQILAAGFRLLRFTASDLRDHPDRLASQVRAELRRGPSQGRLPAIRPR